MAYDSFDLGDGLLAVGTGVLTGAELNQRPQMLLRNEEGLKRWKYSLVDLAAVTAFEVSSEEIRTNVEYNRQIAKKVIKGAVVAIVAPDPVAFGMSRMWQTFIDDLGWTSYVFRSRREAVQWLREAVLANHGTVPALVE